ncbi:MAG: succinate dehydrogenase, cytochrome b556 subunit [Gammaproteobacteria bacterium]|jgi:succinate dehydrogenase / fumarate reductase cytochrome b subunit|nr:MAG: succinate dehydrogenase, cytochrome b556 subunit [Gammaproteobacteria bacterium]
MKTRERPVNLDLTKFSFPLPALTSITHRISGVILFVGLAFLLYAFNLSLKSPGGFAEALALFDAPLAKFITWGLLTALGYHLVAGIKHLFLDFDIGDTLEGARLASQLTIVVAVVISILAGIWVW